MPVVVNDSSRAMVFGKDGLVVVAVSGFEVGSGGEAERGEDALDANGDTSVERYTTREKRGRTKAPEICSARR